jgi:hypothetical protein
MAAIAGVRWIIFNPFREKILSNSNARWHGLSKDVGWSTSAEPSPIARAFFPIMKSSLVFAAALVLAGLGGGCVSADRLNGVRIGMTKEQVIAVMGRPDSTSAQANVEYLTYYLSVASPSQGSEALNNLRVGMTKDQVASIMGQPESMCAQGDVEYMVYFLWHPGLGETTPYIVRVVSGKTESFGRILQLSDIYDRPLTDAVPGQPGFPIAAGSTATAQNPGHRPPQSWPIDRPYSVRLVDGRVESYGRFLELFDVYNRPVTSALPGEPDFPTTADQVFGALAKLALPAGKPAARSDLAGELQKLKALRDQGALTDQEFQRAKAKLLAP